MIPRLVIAMNLLPPQGAGVGVNVSVITSAAAARHPALTLFAIAPQLLVKDILERKTLSLMLALEVGLHFLAFLVLTQRLDRQPDAPFLAVDLDHDCLDLVAHLVERRRLVDALVAELRDMDESLDTRFDLDEHAKVGDRFDLALDRAADRMALRERLPWIRFDLLEPE